MKSPFFALNKIDMYGVNVYKNWKITEGQVYSHSKVTYVINSTNLSWHSLWKWLLAAWKLLLGVNWALMFKKILRCFIAFGYSKNSQQLRKCWLTNQPDFLGKCDFNWTYLCVLANCYREIRCLNQSVLVLARGFEISICTIAFLSLCRFRKHCRIIIHFWICLICNLTDVLYDSRPVLSINQNPVYCVWSLWDPSWNGKFLMKLKLVNKLLVAAEKESITMSNISIWGMIRISVVTWFGAFK